MPELPEVETIRRQLTAELAGVAWERLTARPSSWFRTPAPAVVRRLTGARLESVDRSGKVLLLRFGGGRCLLAHLGMSGQVLLVPPADPDPRHHHLTVGLADGRTLVFRDPRRFGYLRLADGDPAGLPELAGIGADPLDRSLPWDRFSAAFARHGGPVKALLLSQTLFGGIGNVYADEILHAARIRPVRRGADLSPAQLKDLFHAIPAVLREATAFGGTSFDEAFTDLYGRPGLNGGRLKVYGRAGEPCPRCFAPLRAGTVAGRTTHACPRCQA